ncbi:MAG TPA: hypothetical protein VGK73_27995 [Polyangiaceae bacterium]
MVAFRSVTTSGAGNSPDGTENHALPAGTVSGDAVSAFLFTDNSGAHSLSGGSSWGSPVETHTWNGGAYRSSSWTKVAGGSEPANYVFTFTAGYWDAIIVAHSGVDAAAAFIDATSNTGTSTSATGLGVTATRADSFLLWFAISGTGARSGAPTPGTWDNRSTFDTNFYLDDRAIGAGATGNFTSAYPNQEWVVHIIGLQGPEGGGGGGGVVPGPSATTPRRTLLGVGTKPVRYGSIWAYREREAA